MKILLPVYKALHGLAPAYLSHMLKMYKPARPFRSAGLSLLVVPKCRTKTFGEAAFSFYVPNRCNSLPEDLIGAESIEIFKLKLKTYLFSLAFD